MGMRLSPLFVGLGTCSRQLAGLWSDHPLRLCVCHGLQLDSLELTEAKMNAITDKIPQQPVGVVEGASYSLIIIAAFGVSGRGLAERVWGSPDWLSRAPSNTFLALRVCVKTRPL